MKSLYRHVVFSLAVGFAGTHLLADLGDQNPTGVSGQFNGNVTTGGSYDPYTGNATRRLPDRRSPTRTVRKLFHLFRTVGFDSPGPEVLTDRLSPTMWTSDSVTAASGRNKDG